MPPFSELAVPPQRVSLISGIILYILSGFVTVIISHFEAKPSDQQEGLRNLEESFNEDEVESERSCITSASCVKKRPQLDYLLYFIFPWTVKIANQANRNMDKVWQDAPILVVARMFTFAFAVAFGILYCFHSVEKRDLQPYILLIIIIAFSAIFALFEPIDWNLSDSRMTEPLQRKMKAQSVYQDLDQPMSRVVIIFGSQMALYFYYVWAVEDYLRDLYDEKTTIDAGSYSRYIIGFFVSTSHFWSPSVVKPSGLKSYWTHLSYAKWKQDKYDDVKSVDIVSNDSGKTYSFSPFMRTKFAARKTMDFLANDVGKILIVFTLPILLAQNDTLYEFAFNISAADTIFRFDDLAVDKGFEYNFIYKYEA